LPASAELDNAPGVSAFELNVSCPTVKAGGMEFGADNDTLSRLVKLGARASPADNGEAFADVTGYSPGARELLWMRELTLSRS
jgi:hypothetical protein